MPLLRLLILLLLLYTCVDGHGMSSSIGPFAAEANTNALKKYQTANVHR